MSAHSVLTSLFRYKASIDEELLDALGAAEAEAEPQAFHSALRVLNHAHLVDRIFMANLRGEAHGLAGNWSADAPELAQLASDISAVDRWYVNYLASAEPGTLEELVDFNFTDGGRGRMTREEMLAHVATHAGYHRGEVGRLLPSLEEVGMRDVFAGYLHRTEPARRAA